MLYRCYLHLCTYLQRYAAYLVDTRVPGTRHRDSRRGREKDLSFNRMKFTTVHAMPVVQLYREILGRYMSMYLLGTCTYSRIRVLRIQPSAMPGHIAIGTASIVPVQFVTPTVSTYGYLPVYL
jgi:hypothetical protein